MRLTPAPRYFLQRLSSSGCSFHSVPLDTCRSRRLNLSSFSSSTEQPNVSSATGPSFSDDFVRQIFTLSLPSLSSPLRCRSSRRASKIVTRLKLKKIWAKKKLKQVFWNTTRAIKLFGHIYMITILDSLSIYPSKKHSLLLLLRNTCLRFNL